MPEPLKAWLDGYAKEMESIIEVDANEYESLSPRRAQEMTKKSIAPLTTSKWGLISIVQKHRFVQQDCILD